MSTTASPLFTPTVVAGHTLAHRVVMAPMTRARSTQPGDVPNAMNARYYAQRAGAALIVTEATQISPQGKGYSLTPGIYSPEQVAGWRLVTDAVHSAGGRIFLQLWHVGRMSHPDFHNGALPVAPSAVPFEGQIWKVDPGTGVGAMAACPTPRALTREEIGGVVADFRRAARNAMDAGFDGVEIHGANGYLIDQFLRTTSNVRTDEYGGGRDNRLRFLKEVVNAVADEAGADRTAIRLAPFLTARGMACPDILPTILEAAEFLQARGVAYLHLVEADWDDAPQFTEAFRQARTVHAADHRCRQLRRGARAMGPVQRLRRPRCLRPAVCRQPGLTVPARQWPAAGHIRRQHPVWRERAWLHRPSRFTGSASARPGPGRRQLYLSAADRHRQPGPGGDTSARLIQVHLDNRSRGGALRWACRVVASRPGRGRRPIRRHA